MQTAKTGSIATVLVILLMSAGTHAAVAARPSIPFRTVRCTGVPQYPGPKTIRLDPGQIFEHASMPMITFVELEAATGVTLYDVDRVGANKLTGQATYVSSLDWTHKTSRIGCTIVN